MCTAPHEHTYSVCGYRTAHGEPWAPQHIVATPRRTRRERKGNDKKCLGKGVGNCDELTEDRSTDWTWQQGGAGAALWERPAGTGELCSSTGWAKGRAWGETTINHHVPRSFVTKRRTKPAVMSKVESWRTSCRWSSWRGGLSTVQSLQQQNGHEVNACLGYNLGKL